MKRLLARLPYLGLALLVVALLVRALRTEGLELPQFPRPPLVELEREVLAQFGESIAGRVVDSEGQAVAEALIIASLDRELAWAYSDEQGQFSMTQLPEGELSLSVLAREYTTRELSAQSGNLDLVLDLGSPIGPPPSLPEIGEGDLQGQVNGAMAGQVLLGYEVQLIPVDAPSTFGAPIPARSAIRADRSFSFEALLHGEYQVRLLPPWAKGGSWPNLVSPEQGRFVHGPAIKSLELAMGAGELAGRLIDSEGEFVEGALILVEPEKQADRPWPPAQSDEAGGFLVQDLPPGPYRISVMAGEARIEEVVVVISGVTAIIDLPPLALRDS